MTHGRPNKISKALNSTMDNLRPKSPSKRQSVGFVVAISVATIGWFLSGLFFNPKNTYETSELDNNKINAEQLFNVQVKNSYATWHDRELNFAGQVRALHRAGISLKINATVKSIPGINGSAVKKGDPIIEFEPGVHLANLAKAEAVLSKQKILVASAKRLYKKKVRSKAQLDDAVANYNTALASYISAKEKADSVIIKAPYDGIIDLINAEIGEEIKSGTIVAGVGDTSTLKTMIYISEKEIEEVALGQGVDLVLRNGQILTGKVVSIGNRSSKKTRTFPVEIHSANVLNVKDGLSVTAKLNLGQIKVHKIPASILTLNSTGRLGVRTVENNTVRFMPVQIEEEVNGGILISGLPENVKIITVGQEYVKDSDTVSITIQADKQ